MITPILESRCNGCNQCVEVCPTLVLAEGENAPQIVRLDACQTCYMCELYCEQDAIYIAPDQTAPETITTEAIIASGNLGRIRHDQGWDFAASAEDHLDVYWRLGPLLGDGMDNAARRIAARRTTD